MLRYLSILNHLYFYLLFLYLLYTYQLSYNNNAHDIIDVEIKFFKDLKNLTLHLHNLNDLQ
jgi:hypothetical protein